MSEGLPKFSPEATKSREKKEKVPDYRTVKTEILENHGDGSRTEQILECNGQLHRCCVDKVFYNNRGKIEFVDEISRNESGPCDGNHS
jgi:hypothetical protein